MHKIYVDHNGAMLGYLQQILQDRGIACVIKNEFLSGALGDLPANEVWPELWVVEDADLAPAKKIIEKALSPDMSRGEWRCSECGEAMEAQFSECWSCGATDPQL